MISEHLEELGYNLATQRENKSRPLISIFFEDMRKQFEKIILNSSSCNPFPSWPTAAKDIHGHTLDNSFSALALQLLINMGY